MIKYLVLGLFILLILSTPVYAKITNPNIVDYVKASGSSVGSGFLQRIIDFFKGLFK